MNPETFFHRKSTLRILLTAISLLSVSLLTACGSDHSGSSEPVREVTPIVKDGGVESSAQQTIHLATFVAQQPQMLDLEHQEKETLYEDRVVASTCSRTVQRGTHSECRTDTQNECRTEFENVCRQVAFPVCRNERDNICRDIPDQICHNESVPVCHTETRQSCQRSNSCHQQNQHICDSRGCRDVPRTVCDPDVCRNVTENVCHNETHQRCERTTRRECRTEDHQVCHDDYRQECSNVPHERCNQVPHQVCSDVPTFVQEQYACNETQRVPAGERITLHQLAHVKIELRNPKSQNVSVDSALVTLEDGQVQLEMQGEPALQYRIRRIAQSIQRISDTEQVIQASFIIEVQ